MSRIIQKVGMWRPRAQWDHPLWRLYIMDKVLRGSSPYVNTVVMEEFLNTTEKSAKARKIFWYMLGNSIVSCILIYDTLQVCPFYSFWMRVVELTLTVGFTLNSLFHIYLYYQATISLKPVTITPTEKVLLGVSEADTYFRISTPIGSSSPISSSTRSSTPINLSAVSWLSTGSSPGMSNNLTMSAPSWEYLPNISRCSTLSTKGSPDNFQLTPKLFDFNNFSNSSTGLIDNEESLSRYLNELEEFEKSFDQSSNAVWKNSSGRFKVESPILRGCSYQLSTPSPVLKTGSTGDAPDELVSLPSALKSHHDIWARLGVDRTILTQWNSNLRRWISDTILERLVREIDAMDQAFQRSGLADIKMGGVGLERLKKTVQMAQVAQNMPTFPLLVRFLELSSNQEYLVARIRELARGGCMSEFRWSGGGKMHGKDWDEHLPTDAALVMYLMATYLDTQLPPLPHNPEGQPFTSEYLTKAPNKVTPGKNSPVIQEAQINPPHYVLFVRGQKMDVGKGRNNFLHTLLLFLHQMNEREHGMLGRVNMGPSGINLLWVIDR